MHLGIKFCPPDHTRGGSQHTQAANLIRAIHAAHPEVVVFSSHEGFSEIDGLRVEAIPNPLSRASLAGKAAAYFYEQLTFEHRLRAGGCDVLLCPFNSESLLWTGGVPQVLIVRDLIPLVFPEHFPITAWMWRLLFIPAIRKARAVITVSKHTRADLLRILGIPAEKVWVVPNGYHPVADRVAAGSPDGFLPFILYVSSSHYPYKNILGLLEAYRGLKQDFPHRLVVVGQPVPRFSPAIHAAVERLGLQDSVRLLRNLSDQELAGLYQRAELFVYPTLYEGFGMPPLEAMSCGVPVVASNRTSVPEVCGDAALYVDPYQPEEIRRGMAEALRNTELRSDLIRRGLARAAQFDWMRTARAIVEICRQVTGGGAGPEDQPRAGAGESGRGAEPQADEAAQPPPTAAGPGAR
jgi:glycosyltransferase involved in cell wall biosynthesis